MRPMVCGPCPCQVWVKPELRADGRIYWTADSDSQLTKGLAALLVLGLSGCTPSEVLCTQPTFIELLGLKQSLTPSRNNGFLNMFLKMQKLCVALVAAQPSEVAAESHAAS
jgi:sulfur transfer protein SufE